MLKCSSIALLHRHLKLKKTYVLFDSANFSSYSTAPTFNFGGLDLFAWVNKHFIFYKQYGG